ncbi:hypothetical protein JQS65_10705 [Yersinia enterocolitica subsp. palearctica]|nr:hypothetical protein [Yersinia enterocolitica subsp. palearctica]
MATNHWQPQATEAKDASTLISTPASAPRPAQALCTYLKHPRAQCYPRHACPLYEAVFMQVHDTAETTMALTLDEINLEY